MPNQIICRLIVFIAVIAILSPAGFSADLSDDVNRILREIRQDQPVPDLDYLRRAEPINADCAYYRGGYNGIDITVETHPNSDRVASLLLQIAGSDRTKQVLPAVRRVIGPPRYARPKGSEYRWEWPNYRTASVHYVKGADPGEGLTVVSLFYR